MCVLVGGVRCEGEVRRHTSACELYFVPGACLCTFDKIEMRFKVQGHRCFCIKENNSQYLIDSTHCLKPREYSLFQQELYLQQAGEASDTTRTLTLSTETHTNEMILQSADS